MEHLYKLRPQVEHWVNLPTTATAFLGTSLSIHDGDESSIELTIDLDHFRTDEAQLPQVLNNATQSNATQSGV